MYVKLIVLITQCKLIEVECAGSQTIVPVAGDVVTARVLQVNQRSAKCSILCIGEHVLEQNYRAMLRKEDVRATEKDRVEMYKSFRPGDVILARVVRIKEQILSVEIC